MTDTPHRPTIWIFQYRVIKALVLRDMAAQFGLSRIGYLWAFVESALVMVGLWLVFTVRGRMAPPGIPLGVFLITGYPLWFAFAGMWQSMSRSDAGAKTLLMFPQITMFDLLISKFLLGAATQIVTYLFMCICVILVAGIELPADPGGVFLCLCACLVLGSSVGIITHSIRRVFPLFETLISPVRRLGSFVSGVLHTAQRIPSYAMGYFSWNPVFICLEMSRQSWHSSYRTILFDPWYVLLCCVGLLAVGLVLERITRRFVTL